MTYEGLWEMVEGHFTDTYGEKISFHVNGGTSGPVKHAPMGSEDTHLRERNWLQ